MTRDDWPELQQVWQTPDGRVHSTLEGARLHADRIYRGMEWPQGGWDIHEASHLLVCTPPNSSSLITPMSELRTARAWVEMGRRDARYTIFKLTAMPAPTFIPSKTIWPDDPEAP